ncbi:RRT8 (YOL048C) [Zygosaccharomyces parabailii]|nr:RRT8 (YOL048C) [Zygosaccharomyces parabailii]
MKNHTILVSHWKNFHENKPIEKVSCQGMQEKDPMRRSSGSLQPETQLKMENQSSNIFSKFSSNILYTIKWRQKVLRSNFLNDFFLGFAFVYPFTGLFEVLTHRIYWRQIGIFALCYTAVFITIGSAYYVLVLPILLAWSLITLGPVGFLLAHIQWILQTNALTAIVCRKIVLTHINNQIFDTTLYLHGQKDFLLKAKYVTAPADAENRIHWSKAEFWTTVVPVWTTALFKKVLLAATFAAISLVPLVGPPLVNQLISSRRASSYMARYFMLNGMSAKDAKNYEFEHLGLFYSFGMAAGLLEFLPLFSIITMTSNTVGAARWSIDIIKKKR